MTSRYGMTVPLGGVSLANHRDTYRELVDLGYTDVWTAEADGYDGFTPLALAAAWAPELRLGTAIIPAFTRGPALFAQSVASLADAAPGRFVLGLGTSSNVIVERWNGLPFEEPYKRTRDINRFLRDAFEGEKIKQDYDSFSINGYRLGVKTERPPILIAALREGMLRLAGRESEGVILNWLSVDDVPTVTKIVSDAAAKAGKGDPEVVARLFVCPSDNAEEVRAQAKFVIAAYLNVPVYAKFHEWLGRGERLAGMWENWKAGDRKAALAAIDDDIVDELIIHGSPEACKEHIGRFVEAGIKTPALAILPFAGVNLQQAVGDLAPS
jgi:probable F420-dependent oxidoreductase